MPLSVIMTVCLSMLDGTTECTITGRQIVPAADSKEVCTAYADGAINEVFLESGKAGWASGICVDRASYSKVINRSVEYLESKGYKTTFKTYK